MKLLSLITAAATLGVLATPAFASCADGDVPAGWLRPGGYCTQALASLSSTSASAVKVAAYTAIDIDGDLDADLYAGDFDFDGDIDYKLP